jgi:outer membrane protein
MKKIAGIIIVVAFSCSASLAQRSYWNFNYHMSFGTGEQAEFVENTSFRGWGLDGRGFIDSNWSFGGSFSWEVFNQIYRDLPPTFVSVGIDNVEGHITAVQYRYINTLPIMVNSHYYLGRNHEIRPYFGLGVGTAYTEQKSEIGLTSIVGNGWGLAVQPEVGVAIPFGLTGTGINVSGKFRYTTKSGDTTFPLSFFLISVGLGFMN